MVADKENDREFRKYNVSLLMISHFFFIPPRSKKKVLPVKI